MLLDPVPCNGCVTQTLCFVGLWEESDPEHPDGGTIIYVNPAGETITQDLIWQGNFVSIEFIDIISYVGIYEISCNPQAICYEGVWEEGDPAHPEGGSVTYINADGDTIIQDLIWLGDTVGIVYLEIISFTGVVEADCSFPLAYRTPGANEGEISCSSIPPAANFYIYGGDLSCVIADGQIACNTQSLLDKFDGEDKYYLACYALCADDANNYLIQIGIDGYITVIEACPPPPPPP